jgi:predicted nucleotidyltransferase
MNHVAFSRKGGKARSPAKTAANRAKAIAYWKAVREGAAPKPGHSRMTPRAVAKKLAPYCRQNGITQLEAFGSIARGSAKSGSDVDLLVSFARSPGFRFFSMEQEMSEILGVPVHLLTRDSVEEMANPYRKESIFADAKVIFRG